MKWHKKKNYYKILLIDENATQEEIKIAYKKLAKQYHPDINKDKDATAKFQEINEAVSILGNPETRKDYDDLETTNPIYSQDYKRDPDLCNYHLCNKKERTHYCQLCKNFFCSNHARPKPPFVPDFKTRTPENDALMAEWRNPDGHPCAPYYSHWKKERDREQEEKDKRYRDILEKLCNRKNQNKDNVDSKTNEHRKYEPAHTATKNRVFKSKKENLTESITKVMKWGVLIFITSMIIYRLYYNYSNDIQGFVEKINLIEPNVSIELNKVAPSANESITQTKNRTNPTIITKKVRQRTNSRFR